MGLALLFLRLGSSSKLLEIYLLLLSPSLYLALDLSTEDCESSFQLSLTIQLLSLSTRCIASLYFLLIYYNYCKRLYSLPKGFSSYCSIQTIFLQALTSFSCLESYFFLSCSFSYVTFFSFFCSLSISYLSSVTFLSFLAFSNNSLISFYFYRMIFFSVFISYLSPSAY